MTNLVPKQHSSFNSVCNDESVACYHILGCFKIFAVFCGLAHKLEKFCRAKYRLIATIENPRKFCALKVSQYMVRVCCAFSAHAIIHFEVPL